jgi:DNA helicase-2/ATP-dependent DNA helicase PcrA
LNVGDRVSHPVFGQGTVLSTRQMAADTLIEVAFDTVGTKKLMATYAKLRKI